MPTKNYNYVTQFCFNNICINVLNYEYKKSLFKSEISFTLSLKSSNLMNCTISVDGQPFYELNGKHNIKDIIMSNKETYLSYRLESKHKDFRLVIAPSNYEQPKLLKMIVGDSMNYPVIYINLGKKVSFEDTQESIEGFMYQAGRRTHDA